MRIAIRLVAALAALSTVKAASAQSLEEEIASEASAGENGENGDALPGGFRVAEAGAMNTGLALGLTVGYGYTEDVLQLDDSHHRMRGALAATFRPMPWVAAGLRLDGRYDRHRGGMIENDDGYVGEARINVLATRPVNEMIAIGGQLAAWLPGGIDGLSVDAKLVASVAAGPAKISFNGGFRLDRSAESVDDADSLSKSDRLALGVSDSNAVLVGLGVAAPVGPVELLAEGTWDILVGRDAPSISESPLRAGIGVRVPITDNHRVAAMLEGSFGRAPFIDDMQPLVPVEPLIALNVTVSQRPSSPPPSLSGDVDVEPTLANDKANGNGSKNTKPVDPRAVVAGLQGTVRDEKGAPISGAVVRVAGREVLTGKDGTWVAEQLEPGEITVAVSARGFANATESVRLGQDEARSINIILKRLETGTLRGVVVGFDGAPVVAAVKITPGDYTTTSGDDGVFEVDLPAGSYTATATADGFKPGKNKAVVEVPGTVIINIELQKK